MVIITKTNTIKIAEYNDNCTIGVEAFDSNGDEYVRYFKIIYEDKELELTQVQFEELLVYMQKVLTTFKKECSKIYLTIKKEVE